MEAQMVIIVFQLVVLTFTIERAGNKIAEAIEKASNGSTAKEAK